MNSCFKSQGCRLAAAAVVSVAIFAFIDGLLAGTWRWCLNESAAVIPAAVGAAVYAVAFQKNPRMLACAAVWTLFLLVPALIVRALVPNPDMLVRGDGIKYSSSLVIAVSGGIVLTLVAAWAASVRQTMLRALLCIVSAVLWLLASLVPLTAVGYAVSHGTPIGVYDVIAVWQTTPQEALEYVRFKGIPLAMSAVAGTAAALLLAAAGARFKPISPKRGTLALALAAAVLCGFGFYKGAPKSLTLEPYADASETYAQMQAFADGNRRRKEIAEALPEIRAQGENGLFVLVIGESQSRDRMSAYGYGRDTTPWLRSMEGRPGFVRLRRAYSSSVSTVLAVTSALTSVSQYAPEKKLETSPSIIEILNAAGYSTQWFSRQDKIGINDTSVTVIAKQAGTSEWLGGNFDDALIERIKRLPVQNGKTFVVLHTYGCHAAYFLRYPKGAEYWPADSSPNQYDNAVRYNDGLMKELYETLSSRPDFKALIMMSDHAEDMKLGHNGSNFTWAMTRIPVWFAFSESYAGAHKDIVEALRANGGRPFTNDMMFDVLCRITGVSGIPFYTPENDIASDRYARRPEELRTMSGTKAITDDPQF
jgi:heptose-I-phosphate ethanolaminephosphotransferase